jgi:hypothetical protein
MPSLFRRYTSRRTLLLAAALFIGLVPAVRESRAQSDAPERGAAAISPAGDDR